MAKVRSNPKKSREDQPKIRPALTPEARESQLISLAVDLVEQRLLNGTASSQETTHFLKLASMKNRLEIQKLQEQNKFLQAKTEALQSANRVEQLYSEDISVMRSCGGGGEDER